jgi:putative phosphotransacetylase
MEQEMLKAVITKILAKLTGYSIAMVHPEPIPIGVSNRHLHLSKPDLDSLFGPDYQLQLQKDLRQPGQFAAVETVILAGPKGCLEKVRILGPVRKQTQVEISRGDAFRLGLNPPLRESGDIKGSEKVTIIGPKGTVQLKEGLIIAKRHIHMAPSDALKYEVTDGAGIQVKITGERGVVFDRVTVRVNPNFLLEFHLDTDEANAAGVGNGSFANLLTNHLQAGTPQNPVESKGNPSMNPTPVKETVALVTEETVRQAWKDKKDIYVKEGALITPLAKDTIKELGVKLTIGK